MAAATDTAFNGTSWWNYVKVLASDDMEGRETGSPGLRKAQEFVVEQLKSAGLEPVGSRSYYQPVRFESRQIVEQESSLALVHNGQVEPLALGDDAIFSTRVDLAPAVDAPLVFAGYGLTIPELGHDDLAGLDLRDKVVVIFPGRSGGDSGRAGFTLSVCRGALEGVAQSRGRGRDYDSESRGNGHSVVAYLGQSRPSQHGLKRR